MSEQKNPVPGGLAPAAAVDLAALVAYQDGSIVSRTLAKTNGGTVTLFAFAAGQALSEHTAPFDALVLVLEGRLELTIGGAAVVASGHDLVRMPAHVPHALRAIEPARFLLVMLRETQPAL